MFEILIKRFKNIKQKINKWLYVRAMMKAINVARSPTFISIGVETKTNGLRAIKRFEKVNEIEFDPFNSLHVFNVAGNAHNESFFRKMKRFYQNNC